ncbi:MAG TPA: 4-(cytidine 5'-diphospho)-2-C-methyl-D-erythritol kinase [Defluviitoga tunisiensis]|nr:4-(cytidine 5'-diphospho)-2-C-methyl-D-erythritol kinase [Defluviitoga tunisiensis]
MMLKAYGKVNLYLDVIKKRDDGYHDILTLFQSIKEHDIIYVDFSEKEFFESEPELSIPWKDNILKQTIEIFKKETGIYDFNLKIKLVKKLPLGGGVGGGSADSAALLRFLAKNFNISERDIFDIAKKIGSDVPFLLNGGTAIGRGKGDILEYLEPLDINIKLYPMPLRIDTKKMYELLDQQWKEIKHTGDPHLLYCSLKNKNVEVAKKNAFNVFEQIVFKINPQLQEQKHEIEKEKGTIFALMSGTGSTIFRVCE